MGKLFGIAAIGLTMIGAWMIALFGILSWKAGGASAMAGQVPDEVKAERLARLQALLNDQQQAFNTAQVGRTLPVLFEKSGRDRGQIAGRSPYLQAVHCEGPQSLIGRIVPTRIVAATRGSLTGELELATA